MFKKARVSPVLFPSDPRQCRVWSLICLKNSSSLGVKLLISHFLLHTLETIFRLSRVLLDLQKCIQSGSIKFTSLWSSQGKLNLFRNYKAFGFSNPKILDKSLTYYESDKFSDSFLHHSLRFESENFRFPFSTKNILTWPAVKCEALNLGNL